MASLCEHSVRFTFKSRFRHRFHDDQWHLDSITDKREATSNKASNPDLRRFEALLLGFSLHNRRHNSQYTSYFHLSCPFLFQYSSAFGWSAFLLVRAYEPRFHLCMLIFLQEWWPSKRLHPRLLLALGGVAPIAMQVLRVFNHETIAIADYLQWYFRYVPIYNINIGYISIINMWIIEALLKWPKGSMKPLDWKCAGEPLWFI